MTVVYFLIAAVALAGAVALLWLDRKRVTGVRQERAIWGDQHGFTYRATDPDLKREFVRAGMNVADDIETRDVAEGTYYGEETIVFDLAETATIVAIRRTTASSVIIDVRHEKTLAPTESDIELLGAMGKRVMFSSNLDVARRVCDRRMVTLATNAPDYIQILWNEGAWSLASMPITNDPERLDTALETVRRFTDLLRVLPPIIDPQGAPDPRDPSSPTGRARRGLAEPRTESIRREDLPPRPPVRAPGPESASRTRDSGPIRRPPAPPQNDPTVRSPVQPIRGSGQIPRRPGPPGTNPRRPGGPVD